MATARHAWLLIAPLPATAIGLAVASLHGASPTAFVPNAIAIGGGVAGIVWSSERAAGRVLRWPPLPLENQMQPAEQHLAPTWKKATPG